MNIEDLIKKTARATAAEIMEQCKDKRKKDSQLGSFKKTERILYEYPNWKNIDAADTVKFCMLVENALNSVSKDPYYKIIELKYFQKWTHERIAEYFNVDPTLIRLLWAFGTLFVGAGIFAYIIAAIVMPDQPQD